MKIKFLILLLISASIISCNSDSKLNPVRQFGSNTLLDQIKQIDDTSYIFTEKNSLKLFTKSNLASLKTNELYADSIDVERVNKFDTHLLIQTKNNLDVYEFTAGNRAIIKKSSIANINPCSFSVKIDTLVFVALGNNDCGFGNTGNRIYVYGSNAPSKLYNSNDFQMDEPTDMKVFGKNIFLLEKTGILKILSFDKTGKLKVENSIQTNGQKINIYESQKRLLVESPTEIVQYSIISGTQITKLSEIKI